MVGEIQRLQGKLYIPATKVLTKDIFYVRYYRLQSLSFHHAGITV